MLDIIKDSYIFFFKNLRKILWIISSLLFLNILLGYVGEYYLNAGWSNVAILFIAILIIFTELYAVINITKISLESDKKINPSQFAILKTFIAKSLVSLFVYFSIDITSRLPAYLDLPATVIVLLTVFYIQAHFQIIVSCLISGKKITLGLLSDKFVNWLLAVCLIYAPFTLIELLSGLIYSNPILINVIQVFGTVMIYIFSAKYLSRKLS